MAEEQSLGSIRENNATAENGVPPRKRTGCSCWSILLFGVFLVLIIGGGGYMILTNYLNKMSLSRLTAAEQKEYLTWLDTPITFPDHWQTIINNPQPETMRDELEAIVMEIDALNAAMEGSPELLTRVWQSTRTGTPLSDEDMRSIGTAANPYKDLFDHMDTLARQSGYSINQPFTIRLNIQNHLLKLRPLTAIIMAEHQNGQSLKALDHLDAMMRFQYIARPDTHIMEQLNKMFGDLTLNLTKNIVRDDTDSTLSSRALTMLNDNMTSTLGTNAPGENPTELEILAFSLVRYDHPMARSGSVTPRQVGRLLYGPRWLKGTYGLSEYYLWLAKHLPADSQEKSAVLLMAKSYEGFYSGLPSNTWQQITFEVVGQKAYNRGRTLVHTAVTEQFRVAGAWQENRRRQSLLDDLRIQYHLLRLHLARRVAELRGEALPISQSDFVPRYLPEWPADPYSPAGDGFQFDAATGEFYSVGPDGTPGTPDDIKLDKLPARSVAPTDSDDETTATTSVTENL